MRPFKLVRVVELLIVTLLVAFDLNAESSSSASNVNSTRPVVKIGLIVPLTGGLAMRGEDFVHLTEILSERINAVAHRFQYQFVIEDGKCGMGSGAITAANKFTFVDGIKFVLTGCSGETLQVGPIFQKKKVLTVACLSNHQAVSELGNFVFRNFPRNQDLVAHLLDTIKRDKAFPLALVTEENAFTEALKDRVQLEVGNQIIFSEDFPYDSRDFLTLATRLKRSEAKSIFVNVASPGSGGTLINQIRNMGVTSKIYGYYFLKDDVAIAAMGKNAEGVRVVDLAAPTGGPVDFLKAFAEYKMRFPPGPSLELEVRGAYDAISMIVAAVERFGVDSEKVRQYFAAYDAPGALGRIHYDAHGDIIGLTHTVKVIRGGIPVDY